MLLNILATYCIILPSWKDGNHNCMFCLFFVQGIIVLSLYIPLVRMSYSTDMVLDVDNGMNPPPPLAGGILPPPPPPPPLSPPTSTWGIN